MTFIDLVPQLKTHLAQLNIEQPNICTMTHDLVQQLKTQYYDATQH